MRSFGIIFSAFVLAGIFAVPGLSQGEDGGTVTITGRIHRYTSEGAFYGIQGDDGKDYKPIRLQQAFQREGLRVTAVVRPVPKKFLTRGWAEPVDIVEIKRMTDDGRLREKDQ